METCFSISLPKSLSPGKGGFPAECPSPGTAGIKRKPAILPAAGPGGMMAVFVGARASKKLTCPLRIAGLLEREPR